VMDNFFMNVHFISVIIYNNILQQCITCHIIIYYIFSSLQDSVSLDMKTFQKEGKSGAKRSRGSSNSSSRWSNNGAFCCVVVCMSTLVLLGLVFEKEQPYISLFSSHFLGAEAFTAIPRISVRNRNGISSSHTNSRLSGSRNGGNGSSGSSSGGVFDLRELEEMAEQAAEQWDVCVTPFLNSVDAKAVEERLEERSDLGYFIVPSPHPNPSRYRLLLTHPDNVPLLEAEQQQSSSNNNEYSCLLRIDRIPVSSSKEYVASFPHVLTKIGIDLKDVGDAWTSPASPDCAFLVVSPAITKRCLRLMPKELCRIRGGVVGLTISVVDPDHYIDDVDFPDPDQTISPMELSKLDQRALKYNDHPNHR